MLTRSPIATALLSLGLLLGTASPGRADERSDKAKEAYQQGIAHFTLDEYDAAITCFQDAFRIKADPAFLYNIAQAARLGKKPEMALQYYEKYMRLSKDGTPPNVREVKERIESLKNLMREQTAASNAKPHNALPPTSDTSESPPTMTTTPTRTTPPPTTTTRTTPPPTTRTTPPPTTTATSTKTTPPPTTTTTRTTPPPTTTTARTTPPPTTTTTVAMTSTPPATTSTTSTTRSDPPPMTTTTRPRVVRTEPFVVTVTPPRTDGPKKKSSVVPIAVGVVVGVAVVGGGLGVGLGVGLSSGGKTVIPAADYGPISLGLLGR